MRVGVATVARTAAEPVNAAHAQAAGESGYQCSQHRESNQHEDEQREAGKQRGGRGLQDRVDDSDECVKKSHLGDRTLESGGALASEGQPGSPVRFVDCASSAGSGAVVAVRPMVASQRSTVARDSWDEREV